MEKSVIQLMRVVEDENGVKCQQLTDKEIKKVEKRIAEKVNAEEKKKAVKKAKKLKKKAEKKKRAKEEELKRNLAEAEKREKFIDDLVNRFISKLGEATYDMDEEDEEDDSEVCLSEDAIVSVIAKIYDLEPEEVEDALEKAYIRKEKKKAKAAEKAAAKEGEKVQSVEEEKDVENEQE